MGANFKLTNAIDPKIVSDLKAISENAREASSSYAALVEQMAKMTNINPKGLAELEAKASKYNQTAAEMRQLQEELNKLRKEQEEILKKVAADMANEAKIAKDLARAKKDEAKAALDNSKAKLNEAKQQQILNREKDKQKVSMQEAIELSKKEVHSIAEAEAANKKLRQAVKDITDAEDKDGRIRQQLNSTINQNTNYIKRNRDALVQNKMTVGDYKEQIKLAMIELRNGTNTMKNFGIVAKGFGGVLRGSISNGLNEIGTSVGTMIKGFVGAQAVIGGINAMVSAFKNGINTAMGFEQANSTLAAILQTTADKTKNLQMQARELGATTKYTAADATNLQIELAKLGFTTQEISNSTKYVLRFAQATGAELPEAAALTGAALRMFNADTKETERYVSSMAVATSKSALSFSYLATALPIVGPVANSFNFAIEDTLALVGKLADAGFDASMAATATRNIFLNLADANGKLAKRLGEPVKTLPDLVNGLKKLKDEGVDLNETLQLTDKRSVAAFNAFLTAADKINPLRESITGVNQELEDMADTMSNNTAGAIKTLESAWEEFMISLYGNTGTIRQFVEWLTITVRDLTTLVQDVQTRSQMNATKGQSVSATDSDYQKDIDAIKAKTDLKIQLGKDETTAEKEAREEQVRLLEKAIEEEKKLLKKAEKDFENVTWNSQFGETEYIRESAESILMGLSEDVSAFYASVNILEARLNRLNTTSSSANGTTTPPPPTPPSGDPLKEQERLLNLEMQYRSEKNNLLEDSLEKELETIRLNFTRKIAAIKGNSEIEKKLRELYAEQLQKSLADKEKQWADKTKREEKERADKIRQDRIDELNKLSGIEATNLVTSQIEENMALEEKYKEGLLSREEYEREKFELQKKYNAMALENTIKTAEAIVALMPDGADKDAAIAKLRQQQAKLKEVMNSEFDDKGGDEKDWGAKTWQEKWSEAIDYVSQGFNEVVNLMGAINDRQIQEIEEEMDANEKAGEKELERIQRLADSGVITTEEAEARKRAAEEKTAKKNEELEKKKAALQTKQAKLEKAANIASVIMNTASAIMKAWGQTGIFGAPMAALIGAMGAIQLATVIATPIPKYAKGTKDHKGGLAWVGDGGVSETVLTDKGMYITPNTPTLVDLPRGAQVIPYAIDMERMKARANDLEGLMAFRRENNLPPILIENDYSGLQRDIKRLEESQRKGFKELSRAIRNNDYRQFASRI